MKICERCGFRDFKPVDKCPECNNRYSAYHNCNPLDGAYKEGGESVSTEKGLVPSRCIRKPKHKLSDE